MNSRLLLAGVAGGLAMFAWGVAAHTVLPLGSVGIQGIEEEAALTAALKDTIRPPGLYVYPYAKDQAKMEQLLRERPRGILTYTPASAPFSMGANLATQGANDLLAGILLAWILGMTAPSLPGLGAKLLFAAALALLASAAYLGPYWNWYGFPVSFSLAAGLEGLIGTALGTLVIAKIGLGKR